MGKLIAGLAACVVAGTARAEALKEANTLARKILRLTVRVDGGK